MIPAPSEPAFLRSSDALADFIGRFEQGAWPKPMWTHSAHVGLAAWYLLSYPLGEATERLRVGIRKYNEAVGTPNTADNGYHETLTIFWVGIIAARLKRPDTPPDALAAVRLVVCEFGAQRDLFGIITVSMW